MGEMESESEEEIESESEEEIESESEAEPTPVPSPEASPSASRECVASLESFYTDASTWVPYCAQVGALGTCPSPMCKWTSSLLAVRRHKFLGTALIQSMTTVQRSALDEL